MRHRTPFGRTWWRQVAIVIAAVLAAVSLAGPAAASAPAVSAVASGYGHTCAVRAVVVSSGTALRSSGGRTNGGGINRR